MHIIWKRPDGFLDALPKDFRRVTLSSGARLWLHQSDVDWYPFQVSGDWAGQDQTMELNRIVNLVDANEALWLQYLQKVLDSQYANQDATISTLSEELINWLEGLKGNLKGNKWETDIMKTALGDCQSRLRYFAKALT